MLQLHENVDLDVAYSWEPSRQGVKALICISCKHLNGQFQIPEITKASHEHRHDINLLNAATNANLVLVHCTDRLLV